MIDIQKADKLCSQFLVPLDLSYGPQRRFNADGIFSWESEAREGKQRISTYIQLYRSGTIESIAIGQRGAFAHIPHGQGQGTPVIGSTKVGPERMADNR